MIEKVISGGQTGVDRAALDAALALGLAIGGWCPEGRHADDGAIPQKYPLQETQGMDPTVRTENNVRDSDGSLMLYRGELRGGTAYAVLMAHQQQRPVMAVNVDAPPEVQDIVSWMVRNRMHVVHIGGQREVTSPGICEQARKLVEQILTAATGREQDQSKV